MQSIEGYAFFICNSLTSITIPNSVTSIGKEAFAGCDALTSINIPSSIESIGANAFHCDGLSEVNSEATTPPSISEGIFSNIGNPPFTLFAYACMQSAF